MKKTSVMNINGAILDEDCLAVIESWQKGDNDENYLQLYIDDMCQIQDKLTEKLLDSDTDAPRDVCMEGCIISLMNLKRDLMKFRKGMKK